MSIELIAGFLRGADKVQFTISRIAGDQVQLLLQPTLDKEPEGLTDELRQVRAALARPVVIRDTVAGLDARLSEFLKPAGAVRAEVAFSYESALAEIKAAAEKAKAKAAEKGKKPTDATKDKPAAVAATPDEEDSAGAAAPAPPAAPTAPAVDLFKDTP